MEKISPKNSKKDIAPMYVARKWSGHERMAVLVTIMTGILVVVAVANDLRVLP
jgi:hypothetical protein